MLGAGNSDWVAMQSWGRVNTGEVTTSCTSLLLVKFPTFVFFKKAFSPPKLFSGLWEQKAALELLLHDKNVF